MYPDKTCANPKCRKTFTPEHPSEDMCSVSCVRAVVRTAMMAKSTARTKRLTESFKRG